MSIVGRKLTNEDRKRIRDLYAAGERSALRISRKLGVTWNTARKWMDAEQLPQEQVFPAAEILALLKERVPQKQIAKMLKVPFRQIVPFARAHGFARPHFHPTPFQAIKVIDMALSHRFSVAEISRSLRVPYDSARKMVKVILQCEKLVSGGQEKYGLDSYFPSRYKSPLKAAEPRDVLTAEQREEFALFFVDLVRRSAGRVVAAEQLVEVCIMTVTAIYMRDSRAVHLGAAEMERIKTHLQPTFQEAITTLRNAESGLVN